MSSCARLLLLAALPALAGRQWWCAEGEVVSVGGGGAGGGGGGGGTDTPQYAAWQRTAVAVAAGQPAALACRLLRLRDKTVSWVRSRDLQIVCHAGESFTADARVSCDVSRDARGELHALRVARARPDDSGLYECQVNTDPKMSLFFNLTVVDEPVPTVVVEAEDGMGVVRGRAGGAATLACAARYSPARAARLLAAPALHVSWRRGGGSAGGGEQAVSVRGARGGVSLESEAVEARVASRLTLTELRAADAGLYTCSAGNVSATITLHVTADDDDDEGDVLDPSLEAMQRDEAHAHAHACADARSHVVLLLVPLMSLTRSLRVLTS